MHTAAVALRVRAAVYRLSKVAVDPDQALITKQAQGPRDGNRAGHSEHARDHQDDKEQCALSHVKIFNSTRDDSQTISITTRAGVWV